MQDLLGYMSEMLGASEQIEDFVRDVEKYRRGEAITLPEEAAKANGEKSTQESNVKESKGTPSTKSEPQKQQSASSRVPVTKKPAPVVASNNPKSAAAPKKKAPPKQAPVEPKKTPSVQAQPKRPSQLPKGKASVVCGCFGTMHRPLANCIACGRISCEREGLDFCPFCGTLVMEVTAPDPDEYVGSSVERIGVLMYRSFMFHSAAATKAWAQKETILKYQREGSRRSQIFDDQADYLGASESRWLTEEERVEAEANEADRVTAKRPNMALSLG